MRLTELYLTPADIGGMLKIHPKTVLVKLHRKEFGNNVVNVGGDRCPCYRVPASDVEAYLDRRRAFHAKPVKA